MTLVDLSHVIEAGMTTYPGLPGPILCDFLSREASRALYDPGTSFHIGKIELVANTGTYVDAPFHRYEDGVDVAGLPLTSLADLDTVVVRAPHADGHRVDVDALRGLEVRGRAVLVHTGFAARWRTPAYFEGHSFLTEAAALHLRDEGAALVGIDSLNIDDTRGGARPVHSALLGAGIPVCEHLTGLEQLPDAGARFFAVPPKIRALGTFPVRAFART
ncbi:MAG: cyclase family protein [Sandaracinaceae bacterium]|nr:cyclase [Myxococcales bacterium]